MKRMLKRTKWKSNLLMFIHHLFPLVMKIHDDKLYFIDIYLSTEEKLVHLRETSIGQYTHFFSFMPIRYPLSLVRGLMNRARKISINDSVEYELGYKTCSSARSIFSANSFT
uniref:Helix-turn-helix domain-containing protein n=1 Tax=Trichobilharzia regenti TaxID=157069 RepID=A0AA85J2J2_TRIRE|nr:unnamed protein product [Trichobilharzia regenti]